MTLIGLSLEAASLEAIYLGGGSDDTILLLLYYYSYCYIAYVVETTAPQLRPAVPQLHEPVQALAEEESQDPVPESLLQSRCYADQV